MDMSRSGIVAIVGRANVGKSTLMNRLLGEKVSIVSKVAQTTRNVVRGILSEERGQLVFLDTPGMHKARHDLGRLMNRMARAAMEGADVALLLLDVSARPREEDEGWMRKLMGSDTPCLLALNKVDCGARYERAYRECWDRITAEKQERAEPLWVSLSAKTGTGVDALLPELFKRVPEGPLLFPEDLLTDFPRKWAIADVVREQLFASLREEVPHAIAVRVDTIEEDGDDWNIGADILVDRPSQKGIVIGRKGRLLRTVRRQAEAELSDIYEQNIHLDLWVKVEKHWARKHWILRQLGYV
jgi:GTP-binding protein Era